MSEIQVFDPLEVARRERDEARDEARAAAKIAGRAMAENARLAAQLLQDAPIAAAARAWAATHSDVTGAEPALEEELLRMARGGA